MGLATSLDDTANVQNSGVVEMTLTNFDDIDDDEIDSYILSEKEFQCKNGLWYERNSEYLEQQKAKAERLAKEREEAGQGAGAGTGKTDRKRKRGGRKRTIAAAASAGEAIEKILQEKKISTKINYDVLKSLTSVGVGSSEVQHEAKPDEKVFGEEDKKEFSSRFSKPAPNLSKGAVKPTVKNETVVLSTLKKEQADVKHENVQRPEESINAASEEEMEDDYDEEPPVEEPPNEMGVLQMLQQHREGADDENEDFGYNYYEEPEDY
ncbi:unnamed protein product [Acanthoscelides obtectus]|uniref:Brf1 TBP-binding domain-containing protein n=1 Tax=Acanthoscelides obtectus TaxID=200917 RepID=A0A9P0P9E8_ACAOB|nr:unnamed protein product [Acanthoscelides obtectus]CAH1997069.1 unnamed protein product [Acanthoscelides obtectus]CAK1626374.1 Transcription factor IIIB 90 kDa subunit [Acanthoscelides obtectus]CAK1660035.1 Transcription factor IIIB 90 kDa subunit [Acanthoscelides obtectus]